MKELDSPLERRKKLAWSIASSICVQTREDAVSIYDRIMAKYERFDKEGFTVLDESNETK
jgi:hypothetical protein